MEQMMQQEGLTAQDISEELMVDGAAEQAAENAEEDAQTEEALREEIGMLFEDGWSAQELMALTQDTQVRQDVADGIGLIRAAAKMLRRQATPRRRGLPVTRAAGAGAAPEGSRIEEMTDAQFDAFSRQARAAAMMGKKVRM